jgi:hypothetical protein
MQAHLGKTLKLFNISPLEHAEKLNILCDCMASKSQQHGFSDNGCDILPTERWAVYSYHPDPHKVTGPLGKEVTLSLHFHKLATYIYISRKELNLLYAHDAVPTLKLITIFLLASTKRHGKNARLDYKHGRLTWWLLVLLPQ